MAAEQFSHRSVFRQHTTIDSKAAGDQRTSEDRRMYLRHRKPADDHIIIQGSYSDRSLAGAAFNGTQPARTMKGRSPLRGHEFLDRSSGSGIVAIDDRAVHPCIRGIQGYMGIHAAKSVLISTGFCASR